MDNKSEIQDLEDRILTNIIGFLKANDITQEQLAQLCKKNGFLVSQSTLSRVLSKQRRMNIYYLNAICKALGISIDEMINGKGTIFTTNFFAVLGNSTISKRFSVDPNRAREAFQGYMGDYFTYFRSTVRYERDKIIKGILSIAFKNRGDYCWAGFKLNTGVLNEKKEPIFKYYEGQFIISNTLGTGYIFLVDEIVGEISVMAVRHRPFRTEPLECRLASVLTVCAGDERVPTLHRMLLSRERIPDKALNGLLPYLDFGDNKVIVSREDFDSILQMCSISEELGRRLLLYAEEENCVCFDDNILKVIREKSVKQFDFVKFVSELRRHNIVPIRNDRVSASVDSEVYEVIHAIKEKTI